MPTPATPLYTVNSYKVESAYGTIPSSAGAQVMRRVNLTLDLTKDLYTSNEQRTDMQRADVRHGVRRVTGKLSGELSPGSYSDYLAAALKRDWTAIVDRTGITLTIANAGNGVYTLTRAAGDWLNDGVKSGYVFYLLGGTANNLNKRMVVVNVTSTVISAVVVSGATLTTEAAVAGYSFKTPGRINYIPATGHLAKSFSIEKWFSDLVQSEVYSGVRPTKVGLKLPPTGMATIDIDLMGRDMTPGVTQYFTTPAAPLGTGIAAAVNGAVRVAGNVVANVTGCEINITCPWNAEPVVGSNLLPETVPDTVTVAGSLTVNFDSTTLRDSFTGETNFELLVALTTDNTNTTDVLSFVLPRCKATSFNKSDEGGKSISASVSFEAILQTSGGTGNRHEYTTIWMQDTSLA